MFKEIIGEISFFKQQAINIRTHLLTNMLYAMVLRVYAEQL